MPTIRHKAVYSNGEYTVFNVMGKIVANLCQTLQTKTPQASQIRRRCVV